MCEIAEKKLGHVTDCQKVIAASNAYRGEEDYCHLFFEDMVEEAPLGESKEDYILHKNTLADFIFRTKLPVNEEFLAEQEDSFWKYLDSLK